MIINPRIAIQEGWITGIKNEETQIQPNAIDFTLDRLFHISHNDFIICVDPETNKEVKQMRGVVEMSAIEDRRSKKIEFFHLSARATFDGMSDVYVTIPDKVAALLIVRSSYNRNGIFLTSGLYDSGFKGNVSFTLHNLSHGSAKIQKGMRIGQIVFIEADNIGLYAGGYNTNRGEHWIKSLPQDGTHENE